jgi:hypothetical protein
LERRERNVGRSSFPSFRPTFVIAADPTALAPTFEQALAVAMTLPANSRDALLARLDVVHSRILG